MRMVKSPPPPGTATLGKVAWYVGGPIALAMLDVMTVAVIGKLIGTQEVSAYVVVDMLLNLTNEMVGGFWNALTTLCSQAEGAKQYKLCGQVRMCTYAHTR